MLFGLILMIAIFLIIVITACARKYKEHNDEAARKDWEDWNNRNKK